MTLVVSRIVNDVSYVRRINHECYFVGQSSIGVVFCSTEVILEKYVVVKSSTGIVLCSTSPTGICSLQNATFSITTVTHEQT